jgi:carboxylesterase type B
MPFNTPVPNAPVSSLADVKTWLSSNAPYDATPDLPSRILEVYKDAAKTPWEIATLIYTDSQYLCPTARSARWLRQSGRVADDNVFVYRLDYESSTARNESEFYYWLHWCQFWKLKECRNATMVDPGVGHGSDVGLVWMFPHLNETDYGLAKTYVDYWQNFATAGNPNGGRDVAAGEARTTPTTWPKYGHGNGTLVIDRKSHVQANAEGVRCAFWDGLHQVPTLPSFDLR